MSSDFKVSDEEWEDRQLCSDGNCIGVIGPDGRCKECGKPAENFEARQAEAVSPPESEETPADQAAPPEAAHEGVPDEKPDQPEVSDDGDDWNSRRLCPDGNCIGVIGPDGKCEECGRPAE